jgi:hypothetical protein
MFFGLVFERPKIEEVFQEVGILSNPRLTTLSVGIQVFSVATTEFLVF